MTERPTEPYGPKGREHLPWPDILPGEFRGKRLQAVINSDTFDRLVLVFDDGSAVAWDYGWTYPDGSSQGLERVDESDEPSAWAFALADAGVISTDEASRRADAARREARRWATSCSTRPRR